MSNNNHLTSGEGDVTRDSGDGSVIVRHLYAPESPIKGTTGLHHLESSIDDMSFDKSPQRKFKSRLFNPILSELKESNDIKKGAMSLAKDAPTANDINISQELGKLKRIDISPPHGGSSLVIRSRSNS